MSPRKVDRESRRKQILRKAAELFAARGYDGVTMRQVARALGASTGSLYHFFPSKQTLFRDCIRWCAEQQLEQARATVAGYTNAHDQLAALAGYCLSGRVEYERLLLLLLAATQWRNRKLGTEICTEVVDSFVHWLSEIIERGRRQDGIAAGDPATSARTFSGCVAGLALQWHAIGLSQEDARRPEAVPLLMRGLREQGP